MKAELKKEFFFIVITTVCLFLNAFKVNAQISIWSNAITGSNAGQINPYTSGDVVHSNITVSGIGRGTTLTGLNSSNTYSTSNWPNAASMDVNAYFEFSITPRTGYKMALSTFSYTATEVNKSPTLFAFRSNANGNNFATNIGAPNATGTTINMGHTSLAGITSYRLYGWKAGNGAGRNWSVNDFSFTGSVLGSPTTSLSSMGYEYGSASSAAQSLQVNGSGLSSNTITINGSANFEVSTTSSTSGFGSVAYLYAVSGTLLPSTVWVRLKTGKNPGAYPGENINLSCGNVSDIAVSCNAVVTKKSLTVVNAMAQHKIYDGTNTANISGTLSGIIGSDIVTLTNTGIFTNVNAGSGIPVNANCILGGTHASNYVVVQPTGLSADITAKTLTFSNAVAQNKTYDGTNAATITATLNGVIVPDAVSFNGTGTFATSNVGTAIAVTSNSILSGAQAGNYMLTQPTGLSAHITGRTLTISGATAQNKVYDRTNAAAISGTLTGVQGSDVVTLSGTGTFASVTVGTGKAVTSTSTLSGAHAANYTLTQPTGLTANINVKAITVSASANNKIYDRTNTAALTGTISGVIAPDAVSFNGTGTFASVNVGTGIAVTSTSTLTGTDGANYTLTQPTGLNANITAKALTVSATANNKVYNANNTATLTGTLAGVISPDAVTFNGTGTFASVNIGTAIAVTSTSTLSGAQAANYTLTQPTGLTANISSVNLTITSLSANNKEYDRNTTATLSGTAVLNGVMGADAGNVTLDATGSAASFATATLGNNKPVSVSGYSLTGSAAANYTLSQPSGIVANITAKALTVNATAVNKIYDRNNAATLTGTLNGVIGSDVVNFNGTGTFASVNAGTGISVSSTSTLSGADASNYTLTQPTGLSADITARPLTPAIIVNNKIYDGNTSATLNGNITLQNVISGDVINATATTITFTNKNAGFNKTVIASGITLSGTNAVIQNYYLASVSASTIASITERTLNVTVMAADKIYDGNSIAAVTLSDNRIQNDQLVLNYTSSLFNTSNAGNNITVTISGISISGADASNYILSSTLINTQANISARILQISAVPASKIFGTTDPVFTYSITNGQLVPGDVLSGTLTRMSGESVGNYDIQQGTLSASANYQIIYQSAVFTISPRIIFVSVLAGNIICSGGQTVFSVLVSGAGTGLQYRINNGSFQSSPNFPVRAGTYLISVIDADGFTGISDTIHLSEPASLSSDFSITKCGFYNLPWGGIVQTSGSYVNTYTSVKGCDSLVTAHVIIDTVGAVIIGPVNSCRYTQPYGDIAIYSIDATSPSSILWTIPANAILIAGQGTNSISVQYTESFTSGTVTVKVTRSCGGIISRSLSVTKIKPSTGLIAGPRNACSLLEASTSATYSVSANPSVLYFKWILSAGLSFADNDSTSSLVRINFQTGFSSYTLRVIAVSGCAVSDTTKLTVLVSKPIAPLWIKGETNACPFIGSDSITFYQTPKVISRGNYVWTVPQGINIVSHPGGLGSLNDTIIGVKFDNSFISGSFITVQTVSPCGISLLKNIIITRSSSPVPVQISGPANTCPLKPGTNNPDGIPAIYKINKVRFATSYNWILPAGVTLLSRVPGMNDTAITVRFERNFSGGIIGVQSVNGCGVSLIRSLAVKDVVIGIPGAIEGQINPCSLVGGPDTNTYRINKVAGATMYNWTVPTGAIIVGRPGIAGTENDTLIVVRWTSAFISGNISVLPQNNCAVSRTPRTLSIIKRIPVIPGLISGPANPCQLSGNISTYSIAEKPLNATFVKWVAPPGAQIIGSDTSLSVQITFPFNFNSGTLSVKGINNCSSGPEKSLVISSKLPSLPAAISLGVVFNCPSRIYSYSITSIPADAVTVEWTVPNGGTILSGQGTNIINVSYTGVIINGLVTVSGLDGCNRKGETRSLSVILNSCFISAGQSRFAAYNLSNKLKEEEKGISITASSAGLRINSTMLNSEMIHVRLSDVSGRLLEQFEMRSMQTKTFGQNLHSGVYFVEWQQSNLRIVKQIFKP